MSALVPLGIDGRFPNEFQSTFEPKKKKTLDNTRVRLIDNHQE